MEGDMAAPTDVNNDNNSEIFNTSYQPNVSLTRSSNNRSNPDSPDTLPAPLKNKLCDKYGVGILSVICVILAPTRRPLYQEENITDKVLDALTSLDVLNRIIPILSEKIGETISTLIESEIQACVENHVNPLKEIQTKCSP